MIPQGANTDFNPWIKLPNQLEDKEGEIKVNDCVVILDEFKAVDNPKIKSPLIGNVMLTDGKERTVGLNWSSYFEISKVYGKDTNEWINKEIVFKGLKKVGKGMGNIWSAKI